MADSNDIKLIPLTQGKFAIVDASDFDWLNSFKWNYDAPYAKGAWNPLTKRFTRMHRFILSAPDGFEVDHANGNPLDNRRENIRICTRSENRRNRKKDNNCLLSIYKGVAPYGENGKWMANICGKYIGSFSSEIDAAKAYDIQAISLFGKFANLNFPR